jgi:ABC-type multidrug transport system permease subunit
MSALRNSPRKALEHPLLQLVLARLLEFWREPAAIFWVYGFPLLMIIALGVAFRNRPVEAIHVDVQQGDEAVRIVTALRTDPRFQVEARDEESCRTRLRIGHVDLTVVAGGADAYEYRFDPTRPGSALARNAVDDVLQRAAGRGDVFTAVNLEVLEPGGRYIDFLVPGLVGIGLLGGGLWGVGFAIVDMRIRKLLKRFAATPMRQSHFMFGLMISRLLFTLPEVVLILAFARFLFGVVNHGSYAAVGLLVLLGAFQFAGIGLLVASRAQKLETASGLMNLVMMPMWIGSGVFFATERFPEFAQPIIQAMPLTPMINALRSVMNEGAVLTSLGPEIAIMSAWAVVTFLLSLMLFRWK